MIAKEATEERLEKLGRAIGSDDSLAENVMSRIDQFSRIEKSGNKRITRRFAMNRFTGLAAAAVIIIAVALSIIFFDRLTVPAYAIEQTLEAFSNVRFMHVIRRDETGRLEDERWIEIGADGLQGRYRQDTPHSDFFVVDDRVTVLVFHRNFDTVILHGPARRNTGENIRPAIRTNNESGR